MDAERRLRRRSARSPSVRGSVRPTLADGRAHRAHPGVRPRRLREPRAPGARDHRDWPSDVVRADHDRRHPGASRPRTTGSPRACATPRSKSADRSGLRSSRASPRPGSPTPGCKSRAAGRADARVQGRVHGSRDHLPRRGHACPRTPAARTKPSRRSHCHSPAVPAPRTAATSHASSPSLGASAGSPRRGASRTRLERPWVCGVSPTRRGRAGSARRSRASRTSSSRSGPARCVR
jgi:hypothetical protein